MTRNEILARLGFTVPELMKKRVIIHSDIAAEADDQFAVVHHLLTPSEDVVGIIAANFEWRFRAIPQMKAMRYTSMEKSYQEGLKILEVMGIEDVPLFRGAVSEIQDRDNLPDSPGADFIIQEAMRDCDEPLYIAMQGGLTDLAIAYLKEPAIAQRMTAIWIGGCAYPQGGRESNLQQDVYAAQVLFDSPMPIWQIPANVYQGMNISFAELMTRVRPWGAVGKYLADEMLALNESRGKIPRRVPQFHGENWSIGDQPTVSVLLQNPGHVCWHEEHVRINDDMTYAPNPDGKAIRVYDEVDRRLTMEDLYAKLQLCYE